MIQPRPTAESDVARPAVWGLSPAQLHDAFWRSRGVQCIRRGHTASFQRGADLFLLIEPDQFVLFNLPGMADRLAWRAASLTRLRVVDHAPHSYRERVKLSDDGFVRQIERSYRPRTHAAYRVLLTRRRRLARMWMQAPTRRDAWTRLRSSVGLSHIDNFRCSGECFEPGRATEEQRLVLRLVRDWHSPNLAIDGIRETRDGVWIRQGDDIDEHAVVVGPAWIGRGVAVDRETLLVGPQWLGDAVHEDAEVDYPVRLRDIRDIDPGRAPVADRPVRAIDPTYALAKRVFDLVVASVGLVLAAPLFGIIALSIYLSDGRPILYGGTRQGKGGREFSCWKFRTMYRNADAIKHTLQDVNHADGPQFFMENDPRVLRCGHLLRRYHLDELPQLYNVLLGQMSLVGPRPSPESENQKCPAWREIRLSVTPGITGLWQLKRTREPGLDFQEWIRYDVEYVERANWLFDLKIFLATFWVVFGKGLTNAINAKR